MANARRKDIRLAPTAYENPAYIFSVTICTWHRIPLFYNELYAKTLTDTLHRGLFTQKMKLFAYCLMPDHLHLLVSPINGYLPDLISRWKSYTTNCLRKDGLSTKCWQRSFYDHALRREEEVNSTAEYIVNNPKRAGIVNHWQDYVFSWHMWM